MTSRAVDVAGIVIGAFAYGYAAGRTRPLRRLYDRLDYANDRALRGWKPGDRMWLIAAGFAALHPARFVRGCMHALKVRAERQDAAS